LGGATPVRRAEYVHDWNRTIHYLTTSNTHRKPGASLTFMLA
jgi:hypothetical protein